MNINFYQRFKESYKNYKSEWKAFIIIGVIMVVVYGTKPFDLFKAMIQWMFVGIGADLFLFKRLKNGN